MAKVIVEGKFPKRIGNYVLYRLASDIVMKKKSGFTSKALKTSPKYALSRKNASEFGRLSSTCKELRLALKDYLPKKNNLLVVNALTKRCVSCWFLILLRSEVNVHLLKQWQLLKHSIK